MASAATVAFDLVARDRASATLDKVGNKSSSLFSKMGGAAGRAALGLGAVAGAAGIAAVAIGVKVAAANEQARIAFTTMLGSAQKADVFLRDLQAFAAKTPFEFPELQTAASSLISAGIEASKVIPIMTTLGDVTSGMGTGSEGIRRATVALQQMNAAGRITGEDLNQLRDAGIPVFDLLASATGKSKAEVVGLAQAGKLGKTELGQMMKALETGGGLEKFNGLMAKQSKSLTGMWSTLKDTFSMGMATAIEPLIPLLKDGIGGATKVLAGTIPVVAKGFAGLVSAASSLAPVASRVSAALGSMFSGAGGGGQFKALGASVTTFVSALMPAIQGLARGFGEIAGMVGRDLLPAFQKMLPVIAPVAGFLLNMFGSAIVGAIKGAVQAVSGLMNVVTGMVKLVSAVFHGEWGQAWAALKQIASGALNAVVGAIRVWWNVGILSVFKRGFLMLTKGIWQAGWKQLQAIGGRAMRGVGRVIANGLRSVAGFFKGAVMNYLGLWRNGFNLIRSVATSGMSVVRKVITVALRAVVAIAKGAWNLMTRTAQAAFNGLKSAAQRGADGLKGVVKKIPGQIKNALGNLSRLLLQAGADVVQGLASGISGAAHKVMDAARDLANSLPGWVRKVLDMHSPSRVMADIGRQAGEGLAKGLHDVDLSKPARRMMARLLKGFKDGRPALAAVLESVRNLVEKTGARVGSLRSRRKDFAGQFSGFGSSVFGADLSDADTGAAPSAAGVIAAQRQRAASAAQVRADTKRLLRMGLSKSLISQMASSGESGIAQMHALARGSTAQVHALNRLNKATNRDLHAAGMAAGNAMYGDQLSDARRDAATAKAIARAIRDEMDDWAKRDQGDLHIHLEGRDIVTSLKRLKRQNGGRKLGLA